MNQFWSLLRTKKNFLKIFKNEKLEKKNFCKFLFIIFLFLRKCRRNKNNLLEVKKKHFKINDTKLYDRMEFRHKE